MTTPLLLDVDPGNDDAVLLALAVATAELELVGVTTVAGNTSLTNTTRNARAVLHWLGAGDVPVTSGADRPLVRQHERAAVHGPDGLYGDLPTPPDGSMPTGAAATIVEHARMRPGELTLVAVGPLTNVAVALALEPDLPALLDDIVVMGGAARTAGNVTPAAEFNFYADPEAARRVVRDAAPRIVGLDVTNEATVLPDELRELAAGAEPLKTIAGWLAYTEPDSVDDVLAVADRPAIHDPTVGVHLIGDVLEFESLPAVVATDDDCRGALIVDDREHVDATPNADVATSINVEAFRDTLLETLSSLA